MIRLIKISGWSQQAREKRLAVVHAWMTGRGWVMTDYAEEAASALFERAEDAPRLGWLEPTRWFPGPLSWRPRDFWPALLADPRLVVFPLLAVGLSVVLVVSLSALLQAPGGALPRKSATEGSTPINAQRWWVVTSRSLHVREAPNGTAQIVGILYKNQKVLVAREIGASWVKIEKPERGFVARGFVAAPPSAAPSTATAKSQPKRP